MNIDEVLELDYLIEKISDNTIDVTNEPTDGASSINYTSINRGIFNPSETGIYQLDINGQTIEIDVVDIPDSVVWQIDAEMFTTGDSTWSDDVGNNDVSLTGDFQASVLSDGGTSVAGDGTDDYGLFSPPSEISGSSLNNWAVELSVEYSTSDASMIFGMQETFGSNDQRILMETNVQGDSTSDEGNFRIVMSDGSNNFLNFSPSNSQSLNDGKRHIITVNIVDASTNDVNIIIDGSSVSVNVTAGQNPTDWNDWTRDFGLFAYNSKGSISNRWTGEIGQQRIHYSDQSSHTL